MKRILAVDDNNDNLYFLHSLLEPSGFEVVSAENGTRALELLAQNAFDLIISDILMPVMDGFLFCHECRKHKDFSKIPFVFFTATYTDLMDEELALRLGAVKFIRKPIEPDELLRKIEEIIETGGNVNREKVDHQIERDELLKLYSESLINKLEEKNIALIKQIGERQRTEEKLVKSEQRLRSILENEPECVKVVSLDGTIIDMNPAGLRMIEADSIGEVRGRSIIEMVEEAYREDFATLSKQVAQGNTKSLEFRMTGLKGARRWMETNAAPLRDRAGKVTSLICVTRDVTDQKRLARAVLDSEDRYRDLVEHSPIIILTHDLKANILTANRRTVENTGYSLDELRSINLKQLFSREYHGEFDKYLEQLKESGKAQGKGRIITKSGNVRIWEYINTLRTKGVNKPVVRGVAIDITERVAAERALRSSERDYRTVFEQAHDAILVVDPQNKIILDVNERACKVYGYSKEDFMGLPVSQIVADEGNLPVSDIKTAGRASRPYEATHVKKNGIKMLMEVNASRIIYKANPALIMINRDISERKESEIIIQGQKQVLEMVALGKPLSETLDVLLKMVERICPEMFCSIVLLDRKGDRVRSVIGPRLGNEFLRAYENLRIGEGQGSCGTAAYRKKPVIVANIETDPLWNDFRSIALDNGFRACWSTPILDENENALATFAIYYREIGLPSEKHRNLVELTTGSAAIAIRRWHSETELTDSERRLKEAQKLGRIGDWQYLVKTGEMIWSDLLFDISGRDRAAGVPPFEEILEFFYEDDAYRLREAFRAAVETGVPIQIDLRTKSESEHDRYVSVTGTALRDDKREIITITGVAQDITERMASEEAIRFQAHLLDTIRQSVIATDVDGKIIYWNRHAEWLFGWKQDEVLGRNAFDILMPGFDADLIEKIRKRMFSGRSWEGEYEITSKTGGKKPAYVMNSPITDREGKVIGFMGISNDISDRKNAESALLESEERLRKLFDRMIDGFYYSTADGRLIDINPAMVKMFGYSSKEEMLKLGFESELYFDSDGDINRISETGKNGSNVFRMRRKDGSEIWVENNSRLICDDDGNVEFREGVLRDVTERREAEEQLRRTSETLALSQQAANIGSFEWDMRRNNVFWSSGMEIVYGLPKGSFDGSFKTWTSLFHPDDFSSIDAEILRSINSGEWNQEFRIIRTDGSVRWIQIRAKVMFDEGGTPLRMIGINMDVTERRKSEEAISEANSRAIREYENLLDILSELAQTVGAARDIGAIFRAVLKFSLASIPCSTLFISQTKSDGSQELSFYWNEADEPDHISLKHRIMAEPIVSEAVRTGEVLISTIPKGLEYDLGEDHAFNGSTLVAPMKIKGSVIGVIGAFTKTPEAFENEHLTAMRLSANLVANAIENVRLIEMEQEKEEQLQRSQKLESVGRLAGGIAHDFNNMLTAINGYSELVLKRIGEDDPNRSNILEIKKAGERSAELTKQLLAFSRKQVLQLTIVDLNDVIRDTTKLLKRLIGENLYLKTELQPELWNIESDAGQIAQVITNLAVNARDAMPNGGTFTIKTSNELVSAKEAEAPDFPPEGRYVLVEVSDTGIGMGKETLDNIFEPFYTTKVVGKGTGLGLATVYGIIKQSKGHIFVQSRLSEGTRFRIYLPKSAGFSDDETKFEVVKPHRTGSESILIVEDEHMVRALTRQVLEECGYVIFEAGNGNEALEMLDRINYDVDLVLTDVVMPDMGGRELGEKLSKSHPELPILFTSGYTDDTNLMDFISKNDSNYIPKPFTFNALSEKVREFLDSRN